MHTLTAADRVTCPACSSGRIAQGAHGVTIHECRACGAIFGSCYLGDSYGLVLPYFHTEADGPVDQEQVRYYDFDTLGSSGPGRRHGWFYPPSKKIVQVG